MDGGAFSFFAYAGAWASVMAGTWFLFEKAEEVVSSEVRAAASRWLRNLDPGSKTATWPTTFAKVFDRIFGEKHLSWKCFKRSSAASLSAVIIMTMLWGALRPEEFAELVTLGRLNVIFVVIALTIGMTFATAIINFIPDYLSLLETRHVIRWMATKNSTLLPLAFDAAVTAVIGSLIFLPLAFVVEGGLSVVFSHLVSLSTSGLEDQLSFTLTESIETSDSGEVVMGPSASLPMGIWFYSTFFTSVWVWLFALAGLVVKLMGYLGLWVGRLRSVMNIEEKPIRSMGLAAMALVTLVFLVALPFAVF